MDKYEQQETGNPKPSGNISYYKSLKEKEEMCKDMAGYNESLRPGYYNEKIKWRNKCTVKRK